jgi:fumarate reductase iron-sulfur subunit
MQADRDSGTGHDATLQVDVWRGAEHGAYQRFAVPGSPNQTVLDVVTWIQRHLDTTLAYRFACRVGMCGSCAMTVNGRPRWTCRTHVQSVVKNRHLQIGPLRNLPVLRDLATDMAPFFRKWQAAQGRFSGTATRHQPVAVVAPGSHRRRAADAAIECINCAACYAACDVVKWRPAYLGPAALNRAWAGFNDVREANVQRILRAVAEDEGCYQCHSHQSCAEHCPMAVNPTRSIAALKRSALSLPTVK